MYHPYRLHILTACQQASGNVIRVRHEQDGDLHLDLMLDAPYGQLVNAVNRSEQGGALVVEFMARDGGHLPAPAVGDHLLITGAWVNDADHGWNELHPVWSEQIAGGSVYRSGPQYGGSPAGDSSVNAEADCRDPSGHLCTGYGETSSSPSSTSASSSGGASSSAVIPPASHLHAGEFCSLAKEPTYEAAGYTCSPGSDGRERLHSR